jgi:hypothetical protein
LNEKLVLFVFADGLKNFSLSRSTKKNLNHASMKSVSCCANPFLGQFECGKTPSERIALVNTVLIVDKGKLVKRFPDFIEGSKNIYSVITTASSPKN